MPRIASLLIAMLGSSLAFSPNAWPQLSSNASFAPPKDVAEGTVSGLTSIDAGKIDDDPLTDILVAEGGKHAGGRRTFAWFKAPGDTQGAWTRRDISHGASLRSFLGVAKLADMDDDGDLDIVLSSDNHSGASMQADVFIFQNPGGNATGAWAHHSVNTSVLPYHHINDMEIADMDGDGKRDIIVRSLEPNQIHVFFQNAISSFTKLSIDTDIADSEGLAVGDINGDGRMDITYTGFWLRGASAPRSQSYTKAPIDNAYALKNQNTKEFIADIDGDGRLDVVIGPAEAFRGGGNQDLAWYKNPGSGYTSNWSKQVISAATNDLHTVKGGDVDGDGHIDVVVGRPWGAKEVRVYYNDGAGNLNRTQLVTTGKGLYSGVLADLGADGDLDIIGQDIYSSTSKPWVYENVGTSKPAPPTSLTVD